MYKYCCAVYLAGVWVLIMCCGCCIVLLPVLEKDQPSDRQTDRHVGRHISIISQCHGRIQQRYALYLYLYQSGTRSESYIIVYHRIPRHACMHAPGESLPVSSRAVRDRRLLVSSEAVARPLMARQARVSSRLRHSPPRRHPLLGLPLTGFL